MKKKLFIVLNIDNLSSIILLPDDGLEKAQT
jgi:hypothetical protein